jgi:NAD(P)-dependent dehydrogenase (short-subunit alcohol dehydrogenase family)
MELAGKAVLITGGKRLGAAAATAFAGQGADVALVFNRSADEAERTARAIRAQGRRSITIRADLSNPEDCEAAVAGAVEAFGRLDVLVNMASVYRAVALDDTDVTVWDATLNVDLRAAFLCARAAIPHMRRAGAGRIVNFADWIAASGRPRYPQFLPYYVAKHGVIGLTEALALELASEGILVNAIAPGPILPPEHMTAEESRAVEAATPVGRWGGEDEIVKALLFLVTTDFVTGETVRVDGGRHVR